MACANRGARYMLFAEDSEGRIHSALYVVVDATSAYYLLGGADPQYRNSGAQNFLLWEAIRLASSRGLMFNFEGSMIEAIEKVFRGFGARQVPYLHISGARPVTALLLCALPRGVFRRVGLSV
jgi:hypothetical protein